MVVKCAFYLVSFKRVWAGIESRKPQVLIYCEKTAVISINKYIYKMFIITKVLKGNKIIKKIADIHMIEITKTNKMKYLTHNNQINE